MDWSALIPSIAEGATSFGLLVLLFIALTKGWLVTAREAESYRENAQIWKDAYDAKVEKDSISRAQFDELLEASKTTRAFIDAFMRQVGDQ